MKRTLLAAIATALFMPVCFAQPEPPRVPNFGLSQKQPVMPTSKYSYQTPVRKAKADVPGGFTRLSTQEWCLSQGWELAGADQLVTASRSVFDTGLNTSDWFNATVPGTVLTTLVEQGVYPDPFWGLNNMLIPDTLCRTEWWYRNVFAMPEGRGERVELIFNGINYLADVWLNGHKLGTIKGAFRRGIFDVTDLLKKEGNVLAVHIVPPPNPGIPHECYDEAQGPNGGVLCLDGPTFISSEGWDWMPGIRDRNIGLWQDVRIRFGGRASIGDPQVITDLPLPDTTSVDIKIRTDLVNASATPVKATLGIRIGTEVSASLPVTIAPGRKEVYITPADCPELKMNNPRLWWPNGYGPQNLYTATLTLTDEKGGLLDERSVRFGVREMDYELMAYDAAHDSVRIAFNPLQAWEAGKKVTFDNIRRKYVGGYRIIPLLNTPLGQYGVRQIDDPAMGPHIVVKVNGHRIFCKGGNWGMDDIMKDVSRERLEPFLRLHKDMNVTMIRNWTGESTQESFYDLCDEYGILVFNDFWLSTEGYNLNAADNKLFLENVEETVIRHRNHPALALWCPRNEGFAPDSLERYINRIIALQDGTRHYLASSINMNMASSGPWTYMYDPGFYFDFASGFRTEVGTHSLPTAETIRKFMAPEDTWPINDVWYYHDYQDDTWATQPYVNGYAWSINDKFGQSDNLDQYAWRAQLLNYESHRALYEGWASKMWNNTSGIMLWMSHPAWNSLKWQTYTRDCETPGSFFGAKKGCTPLHVQLNQLTWSIDVANATPRDSHGLTVTAEVFSLDGRRIASQSGRLELSPSNTLQKVMQLEGRETFPELTFVRLRLHDAKKQLLDENTYWMPRDSKRVDLRPFNELPEVAVQVKGLKYAKTARGLEGTFTVVNPSKEVALAVKLSLRDPDGQAVLPTFFSDGYFILMPGAQKALTFRADKEYCPTGTLSLTAEAYNMKRTPLATLKN